MRERPKAGCFWLHFTSQNTLPGFWHILTVDGSCLQCECLYWFSHKMRSPCTYIFAPLLYSLSAAYVYDVHKVWGAWSEKLYMCILNGEHNCELEKCCLESFFFTLKMSQQFIKFFCCGSFMWVCRGIKL